MKEVLRPTVIACDIDDEMTESEDSMLFTRTRIRIRERKRVLGCDNSHKV